MADEGQERLLEKMAALGNLVAGVAHEINTPLGAIQSNVDVIGRLVGELRSAVGDDRAHPAARAVDLLDRLNEVDREAVARIVEIVGALRSFARLDEAERKKADLHLGLDSTLTLVAYQTRGRIEVIKEYGQLPAILCYPNRLNQVFMNLLTNAIQAIDDKGRITIRTRQEGQDAVVEIEDSGRGISEGDRDRVFDPGFTTKGVGVGTGLGLSICYRIVHEHGGSILVSSTPGVGSVFVVCVPIAPNDEPKGDETR